MTAVPHLRRGSYSITATYRVKAFKRGAGEFCTYSDQTCDGMDTIAQSEELPELEIDAWVYSETWGLLECVVTWFNGFAPARCYSVNYGGVRGQRRIGWWGLAAIGGATAREGCLRARWANARDPEVPGRVSDWTSPSSSWLSRGRGARRLIRRA